MDDRPPLPRQELLNQLGRALVQAVGAGWHEVGFRAEWEAPDVVDYSLVVDGGQSNEVRPTRDIRLAATSLREEFERMNQPLPDIIQAHVSSDMRFDVDFSYRDD
jgi:hypothetical protein